ncbi:hypothetical protein B0H14DRAFT_3559282 [Mycena olivaceomarginata]|nr:hypothetical protein B0H14DRAFT_3559282 [Mycena olivaceomarginata]
MVAWIQPSSTTKRVVSTTLEAIANLATLVRLRIRIRNRRFWLDDYWVIVAAICSIAMPIATWLRVGSLLGFTTTLWASRMSIMFSVIRLVPTQFVRLRKITTGVAAIFAVFWMALFVQRVHVCASDKSWYKGHRPQQCPSGDGTVVLELVTDIFADFTLAIIPITLTRNVRIPIAQRRMLWVIFAACLLTTVVSILYAVVQLGPGGPLEGVTVQVEAATSLLVANLGVLATSLYRLLRNSEDVDSRPYTYNYDIHTEELSPQRVARIGPRRPTRQSRSKIDGDGEDTAGHIAVFVIQHSVDSDSKKQSRSTLALGDVAG